MGNALIFLFCTMHLNYEWKARITNAHAAEEKLHSFSPEFNGEDRQVDTYFTVPYGRLKLREGNIENALIHYLREDRAGAKTSKVILYQYTPDPTLKAALTAALGVKVVVSKRRRIYFMDNVKFHFDAVDELGAFVEVEAIDKEGSIGMGKIKEQALYWAGVFGILPEDYVASSYSDLLLQA